VDQEDRLTGARSQRRPFPTVRTLFASTLTLVLIWSGCAQTAPPPPRPAPAAETPLTPRQLAQLGLRQLGEKKFAEAAATLGKAAEADGPAAPFLRLRQLAAYEALGDIEKAISVAAQIVATAPETSAAAIARLRLPHLYARAGDVPAMEATYRQTKQVTLDELSEEEFVALAGQLEAAGRTNLASLVRMRLLGEFPQGRFTEKTYGALAAMPDSPLDRLLYDDALALAQRLAREDRYDQEFELLARIARRFPQQASGGAYRATRLRALFNSRRYSALLAETAAAPPDDPALQLLRARAAWRAGNAQDFLAGLQQIESSSPSAKESIEAKVLRAKYYVTDQVDYDLAVANLRAAIAAGDLGRDGENLWNLGWTFTLAGRDADALAAFDDYIARFPDADFTSNALFWSAKIFLRLGRIGERDQRVARLVARYPYSYFSYRAKELFGTPAPDPASTSTAAFPDLTIAIADPRLDTVRELEALGLMRDASREMKRLAADYPENAGVQFMLADIYVRGGEPFKANGILQRRFREFVRHGGVGIPQRFWEILFPLNQWETIQAEAARRGIDPYLVASIIRQESGFEPAVVSNAGAVGLIQIMPAEAESIAARAGIAGITRESLFDPAMNIAVGAAEISQKLQAMNGNPILAIAAYNAGEEAVGKWVAQTPVDDVDLFIESIPYAETRLYVKSVTRNRSEYRRIYERRYPPSPSPTP
jgi:soluble lytic murein transglycosylase